MLHGRSALVTGAAGGIGGAVVEALRAAGADVVPLDLEAPRDGGSELGVSADVSREAEVNRAVHEVVERLGRLDVLVNAAGILRRAPIEACSAADWDDVMAVNLRGTFLTCRAAGRVMLEQGRGSIVNIASLAGHAPSTGRAAYSVSKAGVRALTELLAVEWGSRGVRCNCVSPGHTERGMGGRVPDAAHAERLESIVPLARVGRLAEIADAVLFLASDRSSYVNGVSLPVDGGLHSSLLGLVHQRLEQPG